MRPVVFCRRRLSALLSLAVEGECEMYDAEAHARRA